LSRIKKKHIAALNDSKKHQLLIGIIATLVVMVLFIEPMHVGERVGTILLWPLLAIGIASVLFWDYSEGLGRGDLRFYAVVQFLPVILIPLILLMFPNPAYKQSYIWLVIAVYIAAKLTEQFDHQIYDLCGIGGHTFKHIIAALAGIAFFLTVKSIKRSP